MKSNVMWLLVFFAWHLSSFAHGAVIPPGKSFLSPDKSKSVKLLDYDGVYHYAITDKKTGKVSVLEDLFNPVFAIVWSADSRSIFVVEHVAKGSMVQILHLVDDHWNKYSVGDPEPRFHDSTILDWIIKPTVITITSKITLEKGNGRPYECYIGTYDVDPSTGKTSNLRKKHLNLEECLQLKSKFDPE
jgi:hypothetical protein